MPAKLGDDGGDDRQTISGRFGDTDSVITSSKGDSAKSWRRPDGMKRRIVGVFEPPLLHKGVIRLV